MKDNTERKEGEFCYNKDDDEASINLESLSCSQLVLTGREKPQALREFYQSDFMGKVEALQKIFVPINEDNMHWYLLVIDLHKRQLVLLDSLPCPTQKRSRRRTLIKLGAFIEEMLEDESFYDFSITTRPAISEYPVVVPDGIGVQKDRSNDCGVWVASWMRESHLYDCYDIYVNDATRMRIALDLVLKPYNQIKNDVLDAALKDLHQLENNHQRLVKT